MTTDGQPMISARALTKRYGALTVLAGVDADVHRGEIVAITGASGAGKSTLLHLLGTLDRPDGGTLTLNATNVLALGERKMAAFRNAHIGFVFQFHHLLSEFTAVENVTIPALIKGTRSAQAEGRARELLAYLGLAHRLEHKPGEMSGGEQQRVAVARALMNEPAVVFADEPTGNLDAANAADLHRLLLQLRQDLGQTFVIVTHNAELAALADRTLAMAAGRMLQEAV